MLFSFKRKTTRSSFESLMSQMRTESKLLSLRKSFNASAFISVCYTWYHQVIDNFNALSLNWVRTCFAVWLRIADASTYSLFSRLNWLNASDVFLTAVFFFYPSAISSSPIISLTTTDNSLSFPHRWAIDHVFSDTNRCEFSHIAFCSFTQARQISLDPFHHKDISHDIEGTVASGRLSTQCHNMALIHLLKKWM